MPQREFWTEQHPVEIRFSMRIDPTALTDQPTCTVVVLDQAGAQMEWGGSSLPPGFAAWAMADACRAALEAFDLGTAAAVKLAFTRVCSQWKSDARKLKKQGL